MTDREAVIDVLAADLPQTVRAMNSGAITEEIVFGRDVTPDDDEQPAEAVYDRYQQAAEELVAEGILLKGEALGFDIYGLSPKHQDRILANVRRYLDNLTERERNRTINGEENRLVPMNAFEAAATALRGDGDD